MCKEWLGIMSNITSYLCWEWLQRFSSNQNCSRKLVLSALRKMVVSWFRAKASGATLLTSSISFHWYFPVVLGLTVVETQIMIIIMCSRLWILTHCFCIWLNLSPTTRLLLWNITSYSAIYGRRGITLESLFNKVLRPTGIESSKVHIIGPL